MSSFFDADNEIVNYAQIGEIKLKPSVLTIDYICRSGRIITIKYESQSDYDDAITSIGNYGEGGGGEGGTTNYQALTNKPKINGVTLTGNIDADILHINPNIKISQIVDNSLYMMKDGLYVQREAIIKLIDTPYSEFQLLSYLVANENKVVNGTFYNSDINAYCSFSGLYMKKTVSGEDVHYGYCEIRGVHETEYLVDYRIDWEDSDAWYKVEIVTKNDLTDPVITEPIKANVACGGVSSGTNFIKGTTLESIIRNMLMKVESPSVSLSLIPSKVIYDVVTETISSIILKSNAVKKTYTLKKIELYMDNYLIKTIEIEEGGIYETTYTPSTPIKNTCLFRSVVTDVEGNSSSSSVTVSFVGNSYYGIIEPGIGVPTENQVKSLNKELKISKGYVYKNIFCDYNKVVYAYPASFGALTSIKDIENNVNYTNSFTKSTVKIDNIDYFVYTLNEPTGADGVNLTFA